MDSDLTCPPGFLDEEREAQSVKPLASITTARGSRVSPGDTPSPAQNSPQLRTHYFTDFPCLGPLAHDCGPLLKTRLAILHTTQISNQVPWVSLSLSLHIYHTHRHLKSQKRVISPSPNVTFWACQDFSSPSGEADAFYCHYMHLQNSSKSHHFTTEDLLKYHEEGA